MKNIQIGCKFISILIVLTLILNWRNVAVPLQQALQQPSVNAWALFVGTMGVLFLLLNVVAALGMYLTKWWGFVGAYVAILFSSLFFSTSYVPFVGELLPEQARFASLAVINLLVIAYVIYLNWSYPRK